MAIVEVSDSLSLLAALKAAKGGDTVVLADGDYGIVGLRTRWTAANISKYDSTVTVVAKNPGGAQFEKLTVNDGANLTFDGLTFRNGFGAFGSTDISVVNSKGSHLYFGNVDGAEIVGNHMSGGTTTLGMHSVANFTIRDNLFEKAGVDLIQIGRNSFNGLIENNVLRDPVALSATAHPDAIQIFGSNNANPHDIVIRGNHIYDDPTTGKVISQGIFLCDPVAGGFRNILIEDNLVSVRSPNSIYIAGGQENVIVRENTLIAGPEVYKGGTIRLAARTGYDNSGTLVEHNIARGIINETPQSRINENALYDSHLKVPLIFMGNGARSEDFMLQSSELYPGMGAKRSSPAEMVEAPAAPILLAAATMHNLDLSGSLAVQAKGDSIGRIAATPDLALAEGTVSFGFEGDSVSWRRGLVSRDTAGIDHGLNVWIDSGTLNVSFEDGDSTSHVKTTGIKAGVGYDVQVTFGEGVGRVWLDGEMIGEVATGMDWRQNGDGIILGADNFRSTAGTTDALRTGFDGRITDFAIYDEAMSPQELAGWMEVRGKGLALLSPGDTPAEIAGFGDLELGGKLAVTVGGKQVDPLGHIAAKADLAMAEGTIAFGFDADVVFSPRGLVSRDTAGIDHGLNVWIDSGTLNVSFEDDDSTSYVSRAGIKAGVGYDVQITFGEGVGRVWLDGEMIGEVATDMDWRQNGDEITIGADNSRSAAGTTHALRSPFDGHITDFTVYDEAMTPQELGNWLESQGGHLPPLA